MREWMRKDEAAATASAAAATTTTTEERTVRRVHVVLLFDHRHTLACLLSCSSTAAYMPSCPTHRTEREEREKKKEREAVRAENDL